MIRIVISTAFFILTASCFSQQETVYDQNQPYAHSRIIAKSEIRKMKSLDKIWEQLEIDTRRLAEMQTGISFSLTSMLRSLDEIDNSNAIDIMYNETNSICKITTNNIYIVRHPIEEIKIGGKDWVVFSCKLTGEIRKECQDEMNDSFFIDMLNKYKNHKLDIAEEGAGCLPDDGFDRIYKAIKYAQKSDKAKAGIKVITQTFNCISAQQAIKLLEEIQFPEDGESYYYCNDQKIFIETIIPYVNDIYNFDTVLAMVCENDVAYISDLIETEINKRMIQKIETNDANFFSSSFDFNSYGLFTLSFIPNAKTYSLDAGKFKWNSQNFGFGIDLFSWSQTPKYSVNVADWGDKNYHVFNNDKYYWTNTLDTTSNTGDLLQCNVMSYSILKPVVFLNILHFPYQKPKKKLSATFTTLSAFARISMFNWYRISFPFAMYEKNAIISPEGNISYGDYSASYIIPPSHPHYYWFLLKDIEMGISCSSGLFVFEAGYRANRNITKDVIQNTKDAAGNIKNIGTGGKRISFVGDNMFYIKIGLNLEWRLL